MSPEQANFDKLRRLLVLKRYEQPPPGYFERLPRRVIARIEAGETGGIVTLSERITWEAPWLQRILMHIEGRPAIGAALAVAMCVFLISGLIMSDKPTGELPTIMSGGDGKQPTVQTTFAIGTDGSSLPLFVRPVATPVSSTSGVTNFGPRSTLDAIGQPTLQNLKY
jgi:hypothetical protein